MNKTPDHGWDNPPKETGSPTIKNILDGKSKITFETKGLEKRSVNGQDWSGNYYMYKVVVPHPTNPKEEWETFITTWHPASYDQKPYTQQPEMQITIEAFGKQIPISGDQDVTKKIYDEIARQVSPLKDE